jgi:hypothetical protein
VKVNGVEVSQEDALEVMRFVHGHTHKEYREWLAREYPFRTPLRTSLFSALDALYEAIASGEVEKMLHEQGLL